MKPKATPNLLLDLETSVQILQHVPLSSLDGVAEALRDKMRELKLVLGRRQHRVYSHDLARSGDHGVVRFLECFPSDQYDQTEQIAQLKTLYAAVRGRFVNAGYKLNLVRL